MFLAVGAVFPINASEVVMATTDNECGKIQGTAQQWGTAFANLAAPLDRVARIVPARVQARVGDVFVGRGKIADGIRFGVDRLQLLTTRSRLAIIILVVGAVRDKTS